MVPQGQQGHERRGLVPQLPLLWEQQGEGPQSAIIHRPLPVCLSLRSFQKLAILSFHMALVECLFSYTLGILSELESQTKPVAV